MLDCSFKRFPKIFVCRELLRKILQLCEACFCLVDDPVRHSFKTAGVYSGLLYLTSILLQCCDTAHPHNDCWEVTSCIVSDSQTWLIHELFKLFMSEHKNKNYCWGEETKRGVKRAALTQSNKLNKSWVMELLDSHMRTLLTWRFVYWVDTLSLWACYTVWWQLIR